jgi:hypothetical protein
MSRVGAVIGLYAKSPQSADVFSMVPAFLLGFVPMSSSTLRTCRPG